nr:hypothetical protein [Tanacetum cinerariifolium]
MSRDSIVVYEMFNGGADMVSLYMRCSTKKSRWYRSTRVLNATVDMISFYMRCSTEEPRCLEKIILDVNFLWKEERVRLLVGSSRASTTPSYSPGLSTTPSYSPRRSMTQSYSLGPSTPPSYSPRPSRNAKRANCKLLIGKLQVLEATLEMYMHLEKHAIDLRALQ